MTDIPSSNSLTWDYGTLTQTTYFVRKAVDPVCGTVYSNVVVVNVYPQLTGGTIASNQTLCYNGDPAAFTSTAAASGGSGTLTYTWQYSTTSSTAGSGSWSDIPSSDSEALDYGTLAQTTYFVRRAADAICGTVYSNVITVTVHSELTGGTIASDQTICFGDKPDAFTSLASAAGGSGSYTYTWQYSTSGSIPGSGVWTDLPSSDSETWDPANTHTNNLFCQENNRCRMRHRIYSNVVTVTVHPMLTGGTIAGDQTICHNGDPALFTSLSAAQGGSGPVVYTWQYSTEGSTPGAGTWTDIPSSDLPEWDHGTLSQTTYFVRKAEDLSCGTVYSNVITVTGRPELTGGTIADDQELCSGIEAAPHISSVAGSGGSDNKTYVWQYSTTGTVPGSGTWTDFPSSDTEAWEPGIVTQTTYLSEKPPMLNAEQYIPTW
jgi:hypothetical protein